MTLVPAATRDADRIPQLEAGARIEAGGRLVEQQDARRAHEAGAEVEPAPHATRVVLDRAVGVVGQEDLGEHGIGGGAGPGSIVAEQPGDHHEVLAAGERRFDRRALAGEADDATDLIGMLDRIDAGDVQRSGVGLQQGRHCPDQRGLAGTIRAEHGGDLSGGGDEVETVEGVDVAVVLGDADRLDRRDGRRDGRRSDELGFDGRRGDGRIANREWGRRGHGHTFADQTGHVATSLNDRMTS